MAFKGQEWIYNAILICQNKPNVDQFSNGTNLVAKMPSDTSMEWRVDWEWERPVKNEYGCIKN